VPESLECRCSSICRTRRHVQNVDECGSCHCGQCGVVTVGQEGAREVRELQDVDTSLWHLPSDMPSASLVRGEENVKVSANAPIVRRNVY